jgi:hypothetical protein
MPNSATPMVAIVVQELPESSEINAQMMQALNRITNQEVENAELTMQAPSDVNSSDIND